MPETTPPGAGRLVGGRYRLAAELGRGGMGVVWQADDELIGRQVAIKELRAPAGLALPERGVITQRALAEARNAARVRHPGAVTLHDVIPATDADDAVYLVMELIRAPTLAQVVASSGPLPAHHAASIGLQLLDVLDAAHTLGVVHRDVKPANIMIEPEAGGAPEAGGVPGAGGGPGRARLADFGTAHRLDDPRLTRTGIIGTQAYLAPELFGKPPISSAADLWSLGATLYHAVAGTGPFDRDNTAATLAAILVDDLPAPPCPPPLATAITALLTRDPGRRATSRQVRPILAGAATPAADAGAAPAQPAPLPASAGQGTTITALRSRPPTAPAQAAWEQQLTTHTPRRPGSQAPRVPDRPSLMDPARAVQLLVQATEAACLEETTVVQMLCPELRCLSHIDPARAELIAHESEPTGWLSTKIRGPRRARLLAAATDGLVRRDPGQADRILTVAEHLARSNKDNYAGTALAEVAGQRGIFDTDGALRLLSEAEDAMRPLKSYLGGDYARCTLAYALAGIDPERAENLAHEIAETTNRSEWLVRIADRLARTDVARADAVMRLAMQRLSSAGKRAQRQILADVAGRLACFDIGRAEQAAADVTNPFQRALALADIGAALAPHDRPRALSHLDHSEHITSNLPTRFSKSGRVRLLSIIARGLGPLDPGRAQGLIAIAEPLLEKIVPRGERGIASYYLAACGAGVVLVNDDVTSRPWFTT